VLHVSLWDIWHINLSSFDAEYFDQKVEYQMKLSFREYFFFKCKIYSVKTNGSILQKEALHGILVLQNELIFTRNVGHCYQLHVSENM
jgi:hypothetical protein